MQQETLLTRSFVLLGIADLAYFIALGVSVYALPLYVTGPLDDSKTAAGVAFGAYAVTALLLRPIAGRMCDQIGRRPMLIAGALLGAASLAGTAYADNLAVVVALRMLLGVADAAFFVAALAALFDVAPPTRMGEAVSYNSLGLYLGLALGPPLGELLVEQQGYDTAWIVSGGLMACAAVVSLLLGETYASVGVVPAQMPPLVHRRSLPIALGFLAQMLAVGGFLAFASLRSHDVGLDNASIPLFVYGLTVVICRVVFARVPDRVPSLPLASAALATMAVGLVVIAGWSEPAGIVVGAAVLGVGITFSTPALFSAIFTAAGPDERGAASGTASVALDLGLGLGPILLGVVGDQAGIPQAIAVAAVVAALGSAWLSRLNRRTEPAPPAAGH